MKKFFTIALMAVVAAFTASVAKADISISGYQEFYAESVDQSTAAGLDASTQTDTSRNGLSNGRFTRLIATASTTLDSGIEVGTVFSIARDGQLLVIQILILWLLMKIALAFQVALERYQWEICFLMVLTCTTEEQL